MSKLILVLNCAYKSADGTKYEDGDIAELNYSEASLLVSSGGAKVVRFTDEPEVTAKEAETPTLPASTKEDKTVIQTKGSVAK